MDIMKGLWVGSFLFNIMSFVLLVSNLETFFEYFS